jgi:hypothetical protein
MPKTAERARRVLVTGLTGLTGRLLSVRRGRF